VTPHKATRSPHIPLVPRSDRLTATSVVAVRLSLSSERHDCISRWFHGLQRQSGISRSQVQKVISSHLLTPFFFFVYSWHSCKSSAFNSPLARVLDVTYVEMIDRHSVVSAARTVLQCGDDDPIYTSPNADFAVYPLMMQAFPVLDSDDPFTVWQHSQISGGCESEEASLCFFSDFLGADTTPRTSPLNRSPLCCLCQARLSVNRIRPFPHSTTAS
jgi:hypothetical protein